MLPIKVTLHFKVNRLGTFQFKELRNKKRKNIYMAVEKQQRKRKTGRKWRANEETGGSYTRT